ncbi:hypothetical protein AV530_014878 [Patagioenas fasciata monilis]|uniref:Mos1 transposase HTH domain-containing protein n=1 Tax=Patagioenas fasciata monilis TaxID=372326 RepID=A0A1V4JVG8_PATFA|nr:hypothetical protein AV530_014878 [Patagioenas fasciata monilis]
MLLHKNPLVGELSGSVELSLHSSWLCGGDFPLSRDASQGYSSRLRDPLPDTRHQWTMENMLDKKQIRAIFLFEFKTHHKAAETTLNINASDPGTANERTVQWWFKKFRKGDESLEDEECSGQPLEVDNDQLRAIIDTDPLTTTREVAKELSVNHSTVVQHLKQIGKVKKLEKWVPHELTKNQNDRHFEVSASLILCNKKPFLNRIVTCDEKWILYDNQQEPAQ